MNAGNLASTSSIPSDIAALDDHKIKDIYLSIIIK